MTEERAAEPWFSQAALGPIQAQNPDLRRRSRSTHTYSTAQHTRRMSESKLTFLNFWVSVRDLYWAGGLALESRGEMERSGSGLLFSDVVNHLGREKKADWRPSKL